MQTALSPSMIDVSVTVCSCHSVSTSSLILSEHPRCVSNVAEEVWPGRLLKKEDVDQLSSYQPSHVLKIAD